MDELSRNIPSQVEKEQQLLLLREKIDILIDMSQGGRNDSNSLREVGNWPDNIRDDQSKRVNELNLSLKKFIEDKKLLLADIFNPSTFPELNLRAIATEFIDAGLGEVVAENISQFPESDHPDIAEELIQRGYVRAVARNFFQFKGLGEDTIDKLINEAKEGCVSEKDLPALIRSCEEIREKIREGKNNYRSSSELDSRIKFFKTTI